MRPIDADALRDDLLKTFKPGEHVDLREIIERIDLLAKDDYYCIWGERKDAEEERDG